MTDKEKLDRMKKLADAMYTTAQYLTTDASGLRKAMDEYHRFIITEYRMHESASEDFESEWKRYCDSKGGGAVTMNLKDVAQHFAQWQRERMSSWSEEDEKMLQGTIDSLRIYQLSMPNFLVELQMRWLSSLKNRI